MIQAWLTLSCLNLYIIVDMRHLIITIADRSCEEFVYRHWLRSLLENVNTRNVDVAVLDYGMNSDYTSKLKDKDVIVVKGSSGGHPVSLRLADISKYIDKHKYEIDQVLMVDGGDLIFQSDISEIFGTNKESIRAVVQATPLDKIYLRTRGISNLKVSDSVVKNALNKYVINAGVMVGPAGKMIKILRSANKMIEDKSRFMLEQLALNLVLHNESFVQLDASYNFMPRYYRGKVRVEGGIVYTEDGKKVPIVHNGGRREILRYFRNFGYGNGYNKANLSVVIGSKLFLLRGRSSI